MAPDCRDQSSYTPNQWETSLQCNDVSHWLGAYINWSLDCGILSALSMPSVCLQFCCVVFCCVYIIKAGWIRVTNTYCYGEWCDLFIMCNCVIAPEPADFLASLYINNDQGWLSYTHRPGLEWLDIYTDRHSQYSTEVVPICHPRICLHGITSLTWFFDK